MTRRLLLLVPIAIGLGCGSKPIEPPPLRLAAASDLQAVMPVLISRFKLDTGLEVEPVFGSSGQLAQQIKAGGPFDLFLSASRKFVDDLAKAGAIRPESVEPFTRGSLVLAVYDLGDPGIKGLADLAGPKIKAVAIANPETAPYGTAAKQALERAGLWEAVKPKIVIAESVPRPSNSSSRAMPTPVWSASRWAKSGASGRSRSRPTFATRSSRRWASWPTRNGSRMPSGSPSSCSATRGRGY